MNFIFNAFLAILAIGGVIILIIVLIKKMMAPSKVSSLKNMIKTANYKGAVKVAKEILAKHPNDFEAHFYLGEAYYHEGKHELALIEYKAADKIGIYSREINEQDLREKLAELYIEFNKVDEALKEYALMIKKNQNDYYINFKMGELFEIKNQRQQALSYYIKSFQIKNNYPPTLLNLGILYYEIKKFSEAEKVLEKVVRLEPDNNKAYFYLGMINKNLNNNKKAIKYLEQAQKSKEFKVRSLAEIGMIHMLSNKFEDAVIQLDRALKYIEDVNLNLILNIRYMLASCHEQLRNITDSIKHWEFIYSKKPNFKNIAEKLATYQDLRMDDQMKDYMTATNEEFVDICKKIISKMGLKDTQMNTLSPDGLEFSAVEAENSWRNVKKKPQLFRIYRKSDPIGDRIIRELHETMKKNEIFKGIIITASTFTNQAISYAQERPIQLIDKNNLQDLLKNIDLG